MNLEIEMWLEDVYEEEETKSLSYEEKINDNSSMYNVLTERWE